MGKFGSEAAILQKKNFSLPGNWVNNLNITAKITETHNYLVIGKLYFSEGTTGLFVLNPSPIGGAGKWKSSGNWSSIYFIWPICQITANTNLSLTLFSDNAVSNVSEVFVKFYIFDFI